MARDEKGGQPGAVATGAPGHAARPLRPSRAALGHAALTLAPLALALWLAFQRGGFFAGETAVAALVAVAALLLWLMVAERPLSGLTATGLVAIVSFVLLCGWTLMSALWSDSPARAQTEFTRALLYLATFTLMAVMPAPSGRARNLLRLTALVLTVVVLAGLLSRLYPGFSEAALARGAERLGWPIGYWNALGLAGVLAILGALYLSADLREPGWTRVLAAAVIPALAVTTYLTLSRGAAVAGLVGLAVLLVLGFARGMPTALAAVVPATVWALAHAYEAETLFGIPASREEWGVHGGQLARAVAVAAVVAAAVRLLGLVVDARARRWRGWRPWSRARKAALATAVLAAIVATGAAAGAGPVLERQWQAFRETPNVDVQDPRDRLRAATANGRIEHWEVAVDAWNSGAPMLGTGAGTYVHSWARLRESAFSVQDAHSLYFETLTELGVVGLLLLGVALAVPLMSMLARRRQDRLLWSAGLALAVTWIVHAGVDWDWELPSVTLPIVALLGAACAGDAAGASARAGGVGRLPRLLAGLGILLLMVTPARVAISQQHVEQALSAFRQGRCDVAIDSSLKAAEALNSNPVPFELLGYCDVYAGRPELAVRMLRAAVRRDPDAWDLHYGLALVRGVAGLDPRPEIRRARRLNPLDWRVERAAERLDSSRPAIWRREARRMPLVIPAR